jgi:hypothetical protein
LPREPDETSSVELCRLQAGPLKSVVTQYFPTRRVEFVADMDVDADGANGGSLVDGVPQFAYAPGNTGLDSLANAAWPDGNWSDILVPKSYSQRTPLVLISNDHEGYCSTTAYQRRGRDIDDPNRYLDSFAIPFIVIEGFIRRKAKGVVLGCRARATNLSNGRSSWGVTGDTGPLWKIGEGSMMLAKLLGLSWNPRNGGTSRSIIRYELWPGVPGEWDGEKFDLIPAAG